MDSSTDAPRGLPVAAMVPRADAVGAAPPGQLFSHKSTCVSNLLPVLCWVPYGMDKCPQGSHQLSLLETAARPGSQLVTASWECLGYFQ